MKSVLVSIIIPIYNTGKYLRACVASVLRQTYTNIQVILIDDGSEAPTATLIDELAVTDDRIIVVHKINEGVSRARNVGLQIAAGDIVCFVDSDDTIEYSMIETFVEALRQSDVGIAMCDAITIEPNKKGVPDTITDFDESCIIEVKDIAPATLTRLAGSAWRCAYKRTDTLFASQAVFPENVKFSEDRIFNIIAMASACKIAYIKRPLYHRLIRIGSACFRFYSDMTQQIVLMRGIMIDAVLRCWGVRYVKDYERQIAGHILYAITNYCAPSNGLTLRQQYLNIKALCTNQNIRECIAASEAYNIRSRLLLHKHYILIFLIGKLTNFIHKLCRKGQYR